jgi:hypothetical protein
MILSLCGGGNIYKIIDAYQPPSAEFLNQNPLRIGLITIASETLPNLAERIATSRELVKEALRIKFPNLQHVRYIGSQDIAKLEDPLNCAFLLGGDSQHLIDTLPPTSLSLNSDLSHVIGISAGAYYLAKDSVRPNGAPIIGTGIIDENIMCHSNSGLQKKFPQLQHLRDEEFRHYKLDSIHDI